MAPTQFTEPDAMDCDPSAEIESMEQSSHTQPEAMDYTPSAETGTSEHSSPMGPEAVEQSLSMNELSHQLQAPLDMTMTSAQPLHQPPPKPEVTQHLAPASDPAVGPKKAKKTVAKRKRKQAKQSTKKQAALLGGKDTTVGQHALTNPNTALAEVQQTEAAPTDRVQHRTRVPFYTRKLRLPNNAAAPYVNDLGNPQDPDLQSVIELLAEDPRTTGDDPASLYFQNHLQYLVDLCDVDLEFLTHNEHLKKIKGIRIAYNKRISVLRDSACPKPAARTEKSGPQNPKTGSRLDGIVLDGQTMYLDGHKATYIKHEPVCLTGLPSNFWQTPREIFHDPALGEGLILKTASLHNNYVRHIERADALRLTDQQWGDILRVILRRYTNAVNDSQRMEYEKVVSALRKVKEKKKSTQDQQMSLQVPSTPGSTDAGTQLVQDFPHGHTLLESAGSGLGRQCALHALRRSIKAQFPDLPAPTIEQLQYSAQHGAVAGRLRDIGLPVDTDNFGAAHVAGILEEYGRFLGRNLQLGVYLEGSDPFVQTNNNNQSSPHTVWIYNNGAQSEVAPGHYMGMGHDCSSDSASSNHASSDTKNDQ